MGWARILTGVCGKELTIEACLHHLAEEGTKSYSCPLVVPKGRSSLQDATTLRSVAGGGGGREETETWLTPEHPRLYFTKSWPSRPR